MQQYFNNVYCIIISWKNRWLEFCIPREHTIIVPTHKITAYILYNTYIGTLVIIIDY